MPETELSEPPVIPPAHPRGCQCDDCKGEMAEFEEAARILREAGFIA